MPPYRLLWLEIAERQYLELSEDARELVDGRLEQLEHDPSGLPDAVHDPGSDQWSAILDGHGFVVYAVVTEPATSDRAAARPPAVIGGVPSADRYRRFAVAAPAGF